MLLCIERRACLDVSASHQYPPPLILLRASGSAIHPCWQPHAPDGHFFFYESVVQDSMLKGPVAEDPVKVLEKGERGRKGIANAYENA